MPPGCTRTVGSICHTIAGVHAYSIYHTIARVHAYSIYHTIAGVHAYSIYHTVSDGGCLGQAQGYY
jgi:hypothetical protein